MVRTAGGRAWLAVLLAGVVLAGGCSATGRRDAPASQADAQGLEHYATLEIDGRERNYLIHLPASYDAQKRVPLVLVFHGRDGTGRKVAAMTGFSRLADREGFIAVYPDAVEGQWMDAAAAGPDGRVDDVAFVRALIGQLSVLFAVDPARVYAVGYAEGGVLVHQLGAQLAERIAGIGVVAGALPADAAEHLEPARPVSVIVMHGRQDAVMPLAGGRLRGPEGRQVLSAAEAAARWAQANGCAPEPAVVNASGEQRQTYGPCRDGTAVELRVRDEMGHGWPGGRGNLGAAEEIWRFLAEHPRY